MLQDHLLYFPEALTPSQLDHESRALGLSPWPAAGDYRGLLREPATPARGTVVLFHGNAGHAGHRAWYGDALTRLGLRVILAEYPGYGARTGQLGEESLVADAKATLALARKQFGGPLLVAGESLGAGVAAQSGVDADALLLITPWDKLKNVASYHYPWLPTGLLLRDRYDSVARLAEYHGRIVVVVAEGDALVPARFGRALYDGLPQPKALFPIPGAGHNDWFEHVDAAWWRQVSDFLLARQ